MTDLLLYLPDARPGWVPLPPLPDNWPQWWCCTGCGHRSVVMPSGGVHVHFDHNGAELEYDVLPEDPFPFTVGLHDGTHVYATATVRDQWDMGAHGYSYFLDDVAPVDPVEVERPRMCGCGCDKDFETALAEATRSPFPLNEEQAASDVERRSFRPVWWQTEPVEVT